MTSKLTLDKAGRIVLPKPLRDELRLSPGDALEIESSGEEITLRPLRGAAGLHKKHGVWVLSSDQPLTHAEVEKLRREVQSEREEQWTGKPRPFR
ncbi:MAG: AbrB/MazE/SpoVT family DNA-binding domain-containing protein [Candidatus Acidiferrum sp.]